MKTEYISVNTAAERLLSRRAYSYAGLVKKLCEKGYTRSESETAADRLRGMGYLDDERYAEDLSASLYRRGYGERRVKQALLHKGIDGKETELPPPPEDVNIDETVERLIVKLAKGSLDDRKCRDRVFAALVRRGFDYDTIRKHLGRSGE